MNNPIHVPRGIVRRLAAPLRRPRTAAWLEELPAFAVPASGIEALDGPVAFREVLLAMIAGAERRIVIAALYLQDDEAGCEILAALHAAKAARPALRVEVYVDWHRARRALIGEARGEGNAGLYRRMAEAHGEGVVIRGVPVQTRELFGVLHLKGFVIDDVVLYSGASLNDVYLAKHGRCRLDRYHRIAHAPLAEAMADFVARVFDASEAVPRLDRADLPTTRALAAAIRALRQSLQGAAYAVPRERPLADEVAITPIAGFGRDNPLDQALLALIDSTRERLVLLTPYFNPPRPVRQALGRLLRRGCRIDIVVGDKTANDFYLPPEQPFTTIGLLPYLYEGNLRRYARANQRHLESGQLGLHLWRHGEDSYHLKGLLIDDDRAVLTGSNLNPRAWSLDLENALLIDDPRRLLHAMHQRELEHLLQHATRLRGPQDLQRVADYPAEVRRRLRRVRRVRLDRLVNRLL